MNLLFLSNNYIIGCHAGGFLPKRYILLGKHSLVTPLPGARFKVWQLSSVCVCVCAKHQLFWLLLHLLCALKKLQTFLEVGKILFSQYKFSYLLKACGEPQIFVAAFIVSHIGAWHGARNFLFFSTSTVYQEPIMGSCVYTLGYNNTAIPQ